VSSVKPPGLTRRHSWMAAMSSKSSIIGPKAGYLRL
jgi:hypothetical protein